MYRLLTTRGGYERENVLLLTDKAPEKPTLENIRLALGDFLPRKTSRDDMVLIYYAGYGAADVDAYRVVGQSPAPGKVLGQGVAHGHSYRPTPLILRVEPQQSTPLSTPSPANESGVTLMIPITNVRVPQAKLTGES